MKVKLNPIESFALSAGSSEQMALPALQGSFASKTTFAGGGTALSTALPYGLGSIASLTSSYLPTNPSVIEPLWPPAITGGMAELNETLVAAAKMAEQMLPALEAQRLRFIENVQAIDNTIAKLRGVIAAADVSAVSPGPEVQGALAATFSLAGRDVDQVLFESEEPMRVNAINGAIKSRFGRTWATSTIYGHLNKSKTANLVANEGRAWMMTSLGRETMLGMQPDIK